MAAEIIEVADRHRAELLAMERAAVEEMVRAYATALREVRRRLDQLVDRMVAAMEAGEEISPAWLYQEGRLRILEREIEERLARLVPSTEAIIIEQQAQAVETARQHAVESLTAGVRDPERRRDLTQHIQQTSISPDVLERLVGTLRDGSPLRELLDELGPDTSRGVREILIAGVSTGQNPRTIAAQMRRQLGLPLTRALAIARTEVLRSYRTASQELYRGNSDVIRGWIWTASLDSRTCAACIAMHGTIHSLDEEFGSHVNCRCSPAPLSRFSEVEIQAGADWFAQQPATVQQRVLGRAAFRAYRDGAASLTDFVKTTHSKKWGTTRTVKPLQEIVGARRAVGYRLAAD